MKHDKFFAKTIAGFVEVEGYAIRFDGYDHDFVIHRSVNHLSTWDVSHKKTGLRIPEFLIGQNQLTTRKKAVENALKQLNSVTPEEFDLLVGVSTPKTEESCTIIKTKDDEALELLKLARQTISRLKLSMLAHPDCEEGSEFDDYTSTAQDVEDKLSTFIESVEIYHRNKK